MPRASDGTYSLPSGTLVSTGDTILVAQHNPPFLDVAEALSNSLDRDGKGGMRADLPMGANKITNLAPGTADTDAATVGQLTDSGGTVPLGGIIDFWGSTPPEGFLLCYGQEISRADYADLFAIIGTNAGVGNGSTTFNLPDYRGRVGFGKDNMGGTAAGRITSPGSGITGTTLNSTGGAQNITLTTATLPAHSHGVGYTGLAFEDGGTGVLGLTGTLTSTVTSGTAGSGDAHNNMPPTIICNKIMRCV